MAEKRVKRILIIEDNAAFAKILKLRLESNGYETTVCSDGIAGFHTAQREKPDLVVLDIMLPGMDGHKICRLLKLDQTFRRTPIIICTARDLDRDAQLARQCGADAFVVKTTRPEVILDIIGKLLDMAEQKIAKNVVGTEKP